MPPIVHRLVCIDYRAIGSCFGRVWGLSKISRIGRKKVQGLSGSDTKSLADATGRPATAVGFIETPKDAPVGEDSGRKGWCVAPARVCQGVRHSCGARVRCNPVRAAGALEMLAETSSLVRCSSAPWRRAFAAVGRLGAQLLLAEAWGKIGALSVSSTMKMARPNSMEGDCIRRCM